MTPATLQPIDRGYNYIFDRDELDAVKRCHDEHGFAIVRDVITDAYVERVRADIRASLNPKDDLAKGETRYDTVFIENSPALVDLLENDTFMAVARLLNNTDDVVVNRSAAILKNVDAPAGGWHTDYDFSNGPVNEGLNRGEWPSGLWFYLTGSNPQAGGLAVIEDSHRPDWKGPAGFPLREDRKWFEPAGGSWSGVDAMKDVPGIVPLICGPRDLVIFAARTYHAPHAHRGTAPRYSATIIMRPRMRMNVPWPLRDTARAMLERVPSRLKSYFEGYTSLNQ
jgi:ectoine hydroxylase-related dioxygenase (phytanoyl-CoA dioxygenase family)